MSETAKKVVGLVGHCVPDSSHLTITVTRAVPHTVVKRVTDEAGTQALLAAGVDLLLVNRAMEPGYADALGTDYIRRLRAAHPQVKLMLISNYPESQAEAIKDGALPGFGKSELTRPETLEKLKLALR
jgi:two-component system, chemotaxis family, chemotaxis protein CheY